MTSPKIHPNGKLVVVTGRPAAGKDFIAAMFNHPEFIEFQLTRLVTCASRPPRKDTITGKEEVEGVDYYFVSPTELQRLYQVGELVEPPVPTGDTHRATPKHEFHRVLYEGKRLYWRIDPYLAAKVANGSLFDEQFSPAESQHLKKATLVIYVDAPSEILKKRRLQRDGNKFQPDVYIKRDKYEEEIVANANQIFKHVIQNLEDNVEQTKQILYELLSIHVLR